MKKFTEVKEQMKAKVEAWKEQRAAAKAKAAEETEESDPHVIVDPETGEERPMTPEEAAEYDRKMMKIGAGVISAGLFAVGASVFGIVTGIKRHKAKVAAEAEAEEETDEEGSEAEEAEEE